jgi:plasmid stabilization system protein ParE
VTTRRLIFHPGVEHDLDQILGYYRERDPALPARFRARLKDQIDRIQLFPESGAVLFESYRRTSLRRFPFMVVYRVGDDRIDVLAVVSARRDPAWIEASVSGRAEQ